MKVKGGNSGRVAVFEDPHVPNLRSAVARQSRVRECVCPMRFPRESGLGTAVSSPPSGVIPERWRSPRISIRTPLSAHAEQPTAKRNGEMIGW